jgi:predicted Zn finger-like uncharacterized protein
MIIQCDKCKTRFKLDDSRVTDSGIRVRCSRCSHTFVVRREAPEEESDFESILQGLGGNEPSGEGVEKAPPVAGFSSGRISGESPLPPTGGGEEDETSVDESFADSGFSPDSLSWDEDDQEPESSSVEPQTDHEEKDAMSEKAEIQEQAFSDFLRKGVGLPQFQVPPDSDAAEKIPELKAASGLSSLFENPLAQKTSALGEEPDSFSTSPRIDVNEGPVETGLSKEPEKPLSIRDSIWPVADSKDEEGGDDDLSPLSITSRRKGSPVFPILIGGLLVLLLGGAGFYLFTVRSGGFADLLPESAKALFGLGKKAGGLVEIRSLEGAFLSNREAGEIFVMKGDVFNISSKPLTTIQVKGKIYGPDGTVLAQQTVYCGNVLSGEQLAMQPFSSMAKVMGRQFGETLANFEVQPGKGVPFVIVFKDVPRGAKDFAAEVMSPLGSTAR